MLEVRLPQRPETSDNTHVILLCKYYLARTNDPLSSFTSYRRTGFAVVKIPKLLHGSQGLKRSSGSRALLVASPLWVTTNRRLIPMAVEDWKRSLRGFRAPFDSTGALVSQRRQKRRALGLLVSIPIFALSVLIWYLVARIATYGFFWDSGNPDTSWGGPTLAGAWIVHAPDLQNVAG